MKIIKNYLYNAGYQLLAIIVPFITMPYVSRVLRPIGVGDSSYTNSIIQYFVLIASVGVGYYGNREIAYLRENRYEMSKAFWEIQIVKTVTTVISYILFVLFLSWYNQYNIYLWVQSLNIVAVAFDISWLYMGVENFKPTVVRNTIFKILSTIMIFVFVKNHNDVTIYILITALSVLLGNMILWPSIRDMLVRVKLKDLKPFKHFMPTVALFIPQAAIQVYVQLNKTMLGIFVGTTASGFYQYSDNLVKMIMTIVTATGTVMLPHVSNAFAKGDHKKVNELLNNSFDFVSFIAIPMAFGLAGISLHIAPFFYGKGYGPVGEAMLIESVVIIIIGWSNVIGTQYLLPVNRVKEFTNSVLLGAIVNIILNIPFIYLWGLKGAMMATVISEFAVTFYQLYRVRKDVEFKNMFSNVPKYIISGIIMFIPVFYLDNTLNTNVITLAIEILLGIVLYVVMIFILKPTILVKAKQMIEQRRK